VAQRAVFSVFLVLLLVPAQRVRMFGATRSRCWGCPGGCAARRVVLRNAQAWFAKVDFC
ncbi:hypothetical protein A2U01_0104351, partial [Trifolium medium]|nr:hypothetical protein [Trifolium medium]